MRALDPKSVVSGFVDEIRAFASNSVLLKESPPSAIRKINDAAATKTQYLPIKHLIIYSVSATVAFAGVGDFLKSSLLADVQMHEFVEFLDKAPLVKTAISFIFSFANIAVILPTMIGLFLLPGQFVLRVIKGNKYDLTIRDCFTYVLYQSLTIMVWASILLFIASHVVSFATLFNLQTYVQGLSESDTFLALPANWVLGFYVTVDRAIAPLTHVTGTPQLAYAAAIFSTFIFVSTLNTWLTGGRYLYSCGLCFYGIVFLACGMMLLYFKWGRRLFIILSDIFVYMFSLVFLFLLPFSLVSRIIWRRDLPAGLLINVVRRLTGIYQQRAGRSS